MSCSHLPSPRPGQGICSGFTAEPPKHQPSTPHCLTQWPVSSLGQTGVQVFFPRSPCPSPCFYPNARKLLNQDGAGRGKIRLKGLEGPSHAWRLILGGPCDWMDRLPPPPTTRMFVDLKLEPPVSTLWWSCGLCPQKQKLDVYLGVSTNPS